MQKTITFDCYGTLLDTSGLYRTVSDIAYEHSLPCEQAAALFSAYEDRLMYGEEFQAFDGLVCQVLTWIDCELKTTAFSAEADRVLASIPAFRPFPDAIPALRRLKESGWRIILMSNTTPKFMRAHLAALDGLPDEALTASDVGCYKPDLRFFRETQARFGLEPDLHVHIAKGYWWDIVPASRLGWKKIWVNRAGIQGRQQEQPYLEIADLSQLEL